MYGYSLLSNKSCQLGGRILFHADNPGYPLKGFFQVIPREGGENNGLDNPESEPGADFATDAFGGAPAEERNGC